MYDKVKKALELNPDLVVDRDKVDSAKGFSYKELESYGLDKACIKKLEKAGLALRGYYPYKTGWQTRFILLRDADGQSSES